jgi:two-component system, LytTR family, response regulator
MTTVLTVLIADDEELARRLIREYLQAHDAIEIVGEAEHGLDAVKKINALKPDLVFLDIQMPKLTGLEVLEVTERRTGVIFTTAWDQYALKAFDMHAIDYLLKPFSQSRFDEALDKARKMLGQPSEALQSLIATPGCKLERILIRDRSQVHVIALDKVEYVEAQDDYINIHSEGRAWLKTQALSDLEAQLDARQFVRVHRSFLINIGFLQGIERNTKDSHVALMKSGKQVPISRAGYDRLKELM